METPRGAVGGRTTDEAVVHLFGGPYVSCGGVTHGVPRGSKRLLAFVALAGGRVERSYAAGCLWPFGDETRAAGNLRSSLWRLRQTGVDVVRADKWSLALAPGVGVDTHRLCEWSGRLVHGTAVTGDLTLDQVPADALDLLPGWYDDWVIIERERIRQRVLHAMEALCRQLTRLGRYDEALAVARAAIAAEPLRESAQRVLLETLLATGCPSQAWGAFTAFAELVRGELGVEPSRSLTAMMSRSLPLAVSQ